ncbi:MAG: hypothetical protein KGM47_01195 [Acidobacteriota bacterium]|nr:hypothetical protein [Acidobacteriota bacterium]
MCFPAIPDTDHQIGLPIGLAAQIACTAFGIDAIADANGTDYTFDNAAGQILTIDPANSDTLTGNLAGNVQAILLHGRRRNCYGWSGSTKSIRAFHGSVSFLGLSAVKFMI